MCAGKLASAVLSGGNHLVMIALLDLSSSELALNDKHKMITLFQSQNTSPSSKALSAIYIYPKLIIRY